MADTPRELTSEERRAIDFYEETKQALAGPRVPGRDFDAITVSPNIESMDPKEGAPDATVTISGARLTGVQRIEFEGAADPVQAKILAQSWPSITTKVPVGAVSGPIRALFPFNEPQWLQTEVFQVSDPTDRGSKSKRSSP